MSEGPPEKVAINHDAYAAKRIGWTSDGRQFFLTTPFEGEYGGRPGGEYIALYIFDADGKLIEAKIDTLGPRSKMDTKHARQIIDSRLKELGEVKFGRIEVAPFAVKRFGIEFGLVIRPPEEEGDTWAVEAQPGNYMCFFDPWDSGDYDT